MSKNGEAYGYYSKANFSKFIDNVIFYGKKGYGINEHWKPAYMHCNFCQIDYNVVGRIEKFEEYLDYIKQSTNLNLSVIHMHPSGAHTISKKKQKLDKKIKVRNYLSTLSSKQRTDLYNMFKIDFELFDYKEEEYLD